MLLEEAGMQRKPSFVGVWDMVDPKVKSKKASLEE